MSRDEIDRTLAHLREERERIGAALLELDANQGYRLLEGATPAGETGRVQATVRSRVESLWTLFDLYGRAVGEAEEIRARSGRLGQWRLAELTRLLAGPSIELPAAEVPLERRTLLHVPSGERLTLRAAVERMTGLYEEVVQAVGRLERIWSALLSRLAEAEAARRAAGEVLAGLGGTDAELARLGADLDAVAALVRGDPLALAPGGRPDTARLDALRGGFADARRRLESAALLRDGYAERIRGVVRTLDRLRAAEAEAREVRDTVVAKIAGPPPPARPETSAALAGRLSALDRDARSGGGDWTERARRIDDLERAAGEALRGARDEIGVVRGLLERRDELRGRLDAYRVKAARLGLAEDDGTTGLYEKARALLWTSPCDLREATVALSEFQRAVAAREKGADG
ncbi:hypothetical protein [Actinomadura algeriensis]|uniref:Uncharacterized protein n=1 Tax=Actinomadura algeriensis TaxID=1679523 RepID=A0ABR9JXJ8_9ACTN|nr:hypothetical protein [Actinomadura algeriensis]MBE1534810.1 hypothetical protein [Actinomadura algeriensis]